jgi:ribonuclease HI
MKSAYLFTDGASRGNPGLAGAGFVLMGGAGQIVYEGARFLGEATNNQAEYIALVEGLSQGVEMGFSDISIRMDSELIVKQIKGEYRVKNHGIKPHYKKAVELLNKLESYSIEHIPREKNKEADRLANKAIDDAL